MSATNTAFPRRSLLFMPGDSLRKMQKAATWEVDTIILDLEDAVAQNSKEVARATVVQALATLDFGARERLVRVNAVNSGLPAAEIEATMGGHPHGYIVPKVGEPSELQTVDHWVTQAEHAHDLPAGQIRLFAMIETALGVVNLREIATATPRLEGLIFGAEDLAGDIGCIRTPAAWEVFYARSAVVTVAAAYGCQAFDMIFADFNNSAGLEEESRFARQLGYTGKTCIHPNQTPIVNRAFSPTVAEMDHARRLVQAFAEQQAAGAGAFTFDGKMVDMPMLRAAQRILTRGGAEYREQ